jgi:Glutaredoxin-like domain (DUF836)
VSSGLVEWVVLSRPDCSLCEEFLDELQQLLAAQLVVSVNVRAMDVDSDPTLAIKYGDRIPVLLADGDYVCAIRLDANRVQRLLPSPL